MKQSLFLFSNYAACTVTVHYCCTLYWNPQSFTTSRLHQNVQYFIRCSELLINPTSTQRIITFDNITAGLMAYFAFRVCGITNSTSTSTRDRDGRTLLAIKSKACTAVGRMCGLSTVVTPAGASLTMYREIRPYANSIWDDNNNNNVNEQEGEIC